MPIEYDQLKDAPVLLGKCPKCDAAPFVPVMRGQVHRRKKKWLLFGRWPYCAIICGTCHDIVGYEEP